ncbi:MAG TPA: EAL domain-containing protein [Burkholderiaceae bacterium]|jgi:diguanylate cyclase (GGDEF)-like protein|nr:EAL domain-containing protein [Burkholderiaceae bacterium]
MNIRSWSRDHPIALQTLQLSVAAALSPLIAWGAISALTSRDVAHPDLGVVAYTLGLTAALNVLVLSLWFARRTVLGLDRLKAALRSIGRHASRAVPAPDGGQDLPALTRAFNDVSRHLGLSIATHAALSHIDRTILGSLDIDEIARSAVRCLRLVTGAEIVIVVLNEIPSPNSMLLYTSLPEDPDRIDRAEIAGEPDLFPRIPVQPALHWHGALPLPAAAVARIQTQRASTAYSLFPIPGSRQTRGFVVLGLRRPGELGAEQLDLVGDLIGRLRTACGTMERYRSLKELAHVDALTGLPNRHTLLEFLARALADAGDGKSRVAVLFLDLDCFKQVNDTLGHTAGDVLLTHAAERIRRNVRDGDIVARQGGDEFALVLRGLTSTRDASVVARQLIAALSRRFEIEGKVVFVGASVGIAVFPEDGADPSDLLRKADTAMYRAKAAGRNRLAYFKEHMSLEAQRRTALDGDLREALKRGEFVLHYQPVIEPSNGRVSAVEALVRWRHPTRGLLAPDVFVPFAEESGLIDAIGTWVLKEACLQHSRWRSEGVFIPRVAVNVSIGQMRRSHFVSTVQNALILADMPRHSLEIEVTESTLLQGDKAANDAMRILAAGGVRFAIDDFGTGYSSFSTLTAIPARVLKLDRSFIVGGALGSEGGAILTAMINMAHALAKEVVAEGVETEDQLALLRSLGCDMVQGFLLCKPLPADQIARFSRENLAARTSVLVTSD